MIKAGLPVPPAWDGAAVIRVDEAALAEPAAVVAALHQAWVSRTPVVVELEVDPALFREPRSFPDEPWQVGPTFDPWTDRLHFLVWANTYDGRAANGAPVWWWTRKATRLGGVSPAGGPPGRDGSDGNEGPDGAMGSDGDVRLADGSRAWIDGGPRASFSSEDLGGLGLIHRESVELGSMALVPPWVAPEADLAPDQLAAVGHGSGPARIIAPAGSGKTRVLTERIRHLLIDRGYQRDIVLAVAYNKKAQQEMEERTADVTPRVRTLNALGYRLLAEARGGAPRLLDEREVRRLIERFVPIRRQRANTDPVGPYLEALGQIRLGLRDPEEVEAWRDDVPGLAAAFGPYRAALREAGAVDFDEQIYGCIEALLARGEFRRRAQGGCRHLLVDEFQDLTPAHVLLLRLLATPQLDVFGVGDDDQVIYGHAGADPAFLIGFDQLFPGAADHPLEVNYRCPAVVVQRAADLLSHNRRRVAKAVRPGPGAPTAPDAYRVVSHPAASGADALVQVVRDWLAAGVAPAQIAVLTRVNALLLAPQVALLEAGIPVRSALGLEVLERTGLRAALAYVRIAAAPDGRIAAEDVTEILRRPSRGLPQWFGDRLRRRSWWGLDSLATIASQVPEKEAAKVEWLAGDLSSLVARARTPGASTRSVLAFIKDTIGLVGAMSLLDSSPGGEGSSHLDDLDALEQVAGLHPDVTTFEPWLRDRLAAGGWGGDGPGVTLSTVHRVKGREWPAVAVFGVNSGIFPHRLSEDGEEERRVLHVAVTRCQRQVVLLTDKGRPSPMLAELEQAAPPGGAVSAGAGGAAPPREAGGMVPTLLRAPPGSPGAVAAGAGKRGGTRERVPAADVDPVVEQALRTWRSERSRRDSVAAFIVMHDATLTAIAAARPTSLVALRRIDGIGPAKLEQYGDEILAVLSGLEDGPSPAPMPATS